MVKVDWSEEALLVLLWVQEGRSVEMLLVAQGALEGE